MVRENFVYFTLLSLFLAAQILNLCTKEYHLTWLQLKGFL